MEIHRFAHKLFFLFMFSVCLTAVILLARTRVEAADAISNLNGSASLTTVAAPVNAITNDATTTVSKQVASDPVTNSITTIVPTTAIAPTNPTISTTSTPTVTSADNVVSTTTDAKTKTEIKSSQTQTPGTTTTVTSKTQSVGSVSAARMIEVSVEPVNRPADNVTVSDISKVAPREETAAEPVVMKGADLPSEKNPKVSGIVSQQLSISNVQLVKKSGGQKSLLLSGKAVPNSVVKVYVFSEDPVVITVKADENGDWSYELSKELADGQHEAYVAITDDAGSIVSKATPIAFVKTAEAATVIPYSELKNNESPMQRSAASYVLIAMVIMSVCLVIALGLIGILTHKHNSNEPIV